MQILHHSILWELGKVRFKHGLLLLVWWAHREGISIQVPQAKASGGFSHKTADASTSPGVSVRCRTGGLGLRLRGVHAAGVVGVGNQGIHRSSSKADFEGLKEERKGCGSGEGRGGADGRAPGGKRGAEALTGTQSPREAGPGGLCGSPARDSVRLGWALSRRTLAASHI